MNRAYRRGGRQQAADIDEGETRLEAARRDCGAYAPYAAETRLSEVRRATMGDRASGMSAAMGDGSAGNGCGLRDRRFGVGAADAIFEELA